MRAVVRTTGGPVGRRYYVLRSCSRGSDPTPEHSAQTLSRSRLYDEPGLRSLQEQNLMLIHEDEACGTVVFVSLDAHTHIGGLQGGFLKTIKTRTRTAFVHQSEIADNSAFWDEQLLWLTKQLKEPVLFEERKPKVPASSKRPRRAPTTLVAERSGASVEKADKTNHWRAVTNAVQTPRIQMEVA
eukprot:m51a1_g14069 hypothetical protein (185) ;mRNA; r:1239098-1240103